VSEAGRSSTDLSQLWRDTTPSQRIGLGAFVVICVGLLALTMSLARRPQYVVLYANLQPEDAAEVVTRLRDRKVPYRVSPSGTIEAPASMIDELRLDLAAEALPTGGNAGFELFDRTRVGLSEFGERMNFQRAIQGELARTISALDSVESARVHIALPRERLYAGEQDQTTASVVLDLRGSGQLSRAEVRSVIHLVSGAVGGLSPESVTVLDTGGRLLSNPDDSGGSGISLAAASNQLQLKREYEHEVEQAVQSMLDGVIGPGKAVVRASAMLSFDRVETERETFEPTSEGNGVLESRQETRETYQGVAAPGALGIPGVGSNASAAPATSAATPSADQYERSELTAQYRVSRQVERTLQPPGDVEQLSLSVFIDDQVEMGEEEDLMRAIAAAAGLDTERGDQVVISRVPFEPAPVEEEGGSKAFAIRDFYFHVGRDFAAIVLLALFLRFIGGLLKRRAGEQPAPATATAAAAAGGPQGSPAPASAPVSQVPADLDLDRAGVVLRQWLSSEEEGGDGSAEAAQPTP